MAAAAVMGGAFYPGQRLAIGLALAVWAVVLGMDRGHLRLGPDEWVWLALIGWGVVSAAAVGLAPLAARTTVTGWAVAWCLWVCARRSSPGARGLAAVVVLAAAVLLVAGLVLEAAGFGGIRVGGLLENPNLAASLLVATLALSFALPAHLGSGWRLTIAVLLTGGVAITGSRAGLLAAVAAIALRLPLGRRRAAAIAVGGAAAAAVLVWRILSRPEVLAWFRPSIWLGVLRLWVDHPLLGIGPGALPDAAGAVRLLHEDHIGQRQYVIGYAESTPLGLLVQTGLVGFAIAVVAAALWLRRWYSRRHPGGPALQSAVAAVAVMALFHDVVTLDVVLWWWALVLGLLEPDVVSTTGLVPRWQRTGRALVLAFIVLWGMAGPGWARWRWHTGPRDRSSVDRLEIAERWYAPPPVWRARELLRQPEWTWEAAAEAVARSRRAARAHPGAVDVWMTLGAVHFRIINELGPWPDSVTAARSAFSRATRLEPHQPWSWLEAARLERAVAELDRAAALARRAVEAEPHAVGAWLFLARVELDRGQVEAARAALERAERSARLRSRPGLTPYERELLAAPEWQFRELEELLK